MSRGFKPVSVGIKNHWEASPTLAANPLYHGEIDPTRTTFPLCSFRQVRGGNTDYQTSLDRIETYRVRFQVVHNNYESMTVLMDEIMDHFDATFDETKRFPVEADPVMACFRPEPAVEMEPEELQEGEFGLEVDFLLMRSEG